MTSKDPEAVSLISCSLVLLPPPPWDNVQRRPFLVAGLMVRVFPGYRAGSQDKSSITETPKGLLPPVAISSRLNRSKHQGLVWSHG